MYNYAVSGPNAEYICNLHQSTAWGNDSVLGYLVNNNSYGLGINIDPKIFNWLVIHYCEEDSRFLIDILKLLKEKILLQKNC